MNQTRIASGLTFCTVVRHGQLSRAHALADSVHAHHPDAPLFVLVLDPPTGGVDGGESFTIVGLEDLGLPDLTRLRFLCSASKLARVAKPYLLTHLLARGARKLVYADPGLILADNLRSVERRLTRHAIIMAPHLAVLDGTAEDVGPGDPPFVALARGTTADAYLSWWRDIEGAGDGEREWWTGPVWIDPVPSVIRRDSPSSRKQPYGWGQFDNGVAVTELVRRCFLKLGSAAAAFGDPLVTAGQSFFTYLTTPGESNLLPLLREIYDERPDIRVHFPDVAGRDRDAFLSWAATLGARDQGLDPVLLGAPPSPCETRGATLASGSPVSERFGINLLGFFQSEKGMGEHCRATARSLQAVNVPFALNNWVDPGSANVDTTFYDFNSDNPYPVNLIHLNASDAPYFAREMPGYLQGRYNIGYWNWELEWFPEAWRGSFQYFDEIWAPSTFTRDSIARVSPIPVHTMPIAIPTAPTGSANRARFRLPPHAFLFLFAFDFHSFFARKNPLAVVEAFRRAFPTRRDVVLVLKLVHWESVPMDFAEVLTACRGQPNIRILREVLSRGEMYDLLRLCDAYVGLHRSEGFGLPLAEAMALGKPVIATDYSANVDFMNESNSYPVRYRMVAIEKDHGPYRKGAEWADPNVDHAAEQMRRVVEEPTAAWLVAARARADIARLLSPQAIGQKIRDRLTAILHRGAAAHDARFAPPSEILAA